MLASTREDEQIIERIAALDIGKAEVVCCVRVPDPSHPGRRLQEVSTHRTMTRSLLLMCDRLRELGRASAKSGCRAVTCGNSLVQPAWRV